MSETETAIRVQALTKRFGRLGKVEALHAIDLQIAPGSIYALVGPNGAGKSTCPASDEEVQSRRPSGEYGEKFGGARDTPPAKASKPLARRIHPAQPQPICESF